MRLSRPRLALACLAALSLAATLPQEEVVLEAGDLRFRWVPDWLQVPGGGDLGNTHGCVAPLPGGDMLFNTDAEHAVVRVSPDGAWKATFGAELRGGLHGMTTRVEGDRIALYLTHTGRHEMVKTSVDGTVEMVLGWPEASGKYDSADQYRPTAVAVAPDGRIFVADGYGRSWVHRYAADGTWLGCFGGQGTAPGQMRTPHGLVIDTRTEPARLVVCDRENGRLQTFDLDGNLLGVHTGHLRRPCSAALHGDHLAIADLAGRVTLLDERFELVGHLGDQPDPKLRAVNGVGKDLWRDGEFLSPHGIGWGADGSLYVLDWNRHGRVTRLQPLQER